MYIKVDSFGNVIEAATMPERIEDFIYVENDSVSSLDGWKYENGELNYYPEIAEEMERQYEENRKRDIRNAPVLLQTQYITREDFNLIDAQDDHILYYILEEDGTTTMLKGENV